MTPADKARARELLEEHDNVDACGELRPSDVMRMAQFPDLLERALAEIERLEAEVAEWQKIGPNALKALRLKDEALARRAAVEEQVVGVIDGLDREIQARADDLAKPAGGMRVSFHGDFASAGPGVINRLRWWAKELRAALRSDAPVKEDDR